MSSSRSRWLMILGIAVGVLFLWLAVRDIDLAQLRAAFGRAKLWLAAPFLLALFLFYWTKSARWADLLAPLKRLKTAELFPPVMIGYAGSAILPMQLGELVRVYVARRAFDLRVTPLLASIVLERVFDLATVVLLVALVLMFAQVVPAGLDRAGYLLALAGALLLGACAVYVARPGWAIGLARWMARPLPRSLAERLIEQVELGSRGMHALREPQLLARIVATSVGQWLFMGVCCWLSLLAFDLAVPPSAAVVVLALTVVGVSLPTSPGFVGSIQLAYYLALTPYAVSPADALAASVFFHVLAYLSVVLAGLYYLHRSDLTFGRLRAAAAQTPGEV